MDNFEDIINIPHHISDKRIPMSMYDRAVQFAPFAALTGYDEEIDETARLTDPFIDLTEDRADELNIAFRKMLASDRPCVTVTYFKPDSKKEGGCYEKYSGIFRFFDAAGNLIKFTDGKCINAERICKIEFSQNL